MKDKSLSWQRQIEKQRHSSLTKQAYYDRYELSSGMFYYWKRKLSSGLLSNKEFRELEIIAQDHVHPVIEVYLGMGKLIRIEDPVSASFLRELIQC